MLSSSVTEQNNDATTTVDTHENNSAFFNKLAMLIITLVIFVLLGCLIYALIGIGTKNSTSSINFKFDSCHIEKLDSTFIFANKEFIRDFNLKMDTLKDETIKLKEIKSQMDETQKKNDDYFRLILALVGSVFAIVGFFGFKSISDTRQATLDAAKIKAETVAENSAKIKAESTVRIYLEKEGENILKASAAKTAGDVATDVAAKVSFDTATKTATSIAQDEVRKYFANHKELEKALQQSISLLEKENNTLRARIIEIENEIFGTAQDTDDDAPSSQPTDTPVV